MATDLMAQVKATLEALQTQQTADKTQAEAMLAELRVANDQLTEELQKCKSRLDQDHLNFKYTTLLETYNEAEYENKKLKEQVTRGTQKMTELRDHYEQLRAQCLEALDENRKLRLRLPGSRPYEPSYGVPPFHDLKRIVFLE